MQNFTAPPVLFRLLNPITLAAYASYRFRLLLFFILALAVNTYSATITAIGSGTWVTNGIWSCNCQPTNADNIIIPSSTTVTITGPALLILGPVINITVSGTLVLNNASLQIDGNDILNIPSGGKITGMGLTGGAVWSGIVPIGVPNGSTINGPKVITGGVLPVKLLFFKGHVNNNEVTLTWASVKEADFDFYTVERSINDTDFEPIGQIKGAGNSLTRMDYSFTDGTPVQGVSYYRLKTVDVGGRTEILDMVAINYTPVAQTMTIYPNPVRGTEVTLILNFEAKNGSIIFYDNYGRHLLQKSLTGDNHQYHIALPSTLNKGIYFIQIRTPDTMVQSSIAIE